MGWLKTDGHAENTNDLEAIIQIIQIIQIVLYLCNMKLKLFTNINKQSIFRLLTEFLKNHKHLNLISFAL